MAEKKSEEIKKTKTRGRGRPAKSKIEADPREKELLAITNGKLWSFQDLVTIDTEILFEVGLAPALLLGAISAEQKKLLTGTDGSKVKALEPIKLNMTVEDYRTGKSEWADGLKTLEYLNFVDLYNLDGTVGAKINRQEIERFMIMRFWKKGGLEEALKQ